MIVMVPADGLMEVAMLPALDRTFTRVPLAMEDGPCAPPHADPDRPRATA